ncbi:ankyrin repeat domain-containing protein SOWAHC-like [Genypterus blacodes]|uniref:ankyrin repeat domain-containing protein SOWAHC-like n=1 Tax=Genypterus blacodes TaxID=154954 RepID=UPI003F76BC52
MGNRGSSLSQRRTSRKSRTLSTKQEGTSDVPHITVVEASPLPAQDSVFQLPDAAPAGALEPRAARAPEATTQENLSVLDAEASRRNSRGSQHRLPSSPLGSDDREDEAAASPKGSRVHFIEVMMHSSPQVRRSMVLRNSVNLSSRGEDSLSDCDSVSLLSSSLEEERSPVTLDPLEHQWMMCVSDGEWAPLQELLTLEPGLTLRRDFVTGFTCLHWAAKQGKPELVALMVNFAQQHDLPVDINARSSNGYTPLHVAAMHNNMEVVKLLVGAYSADVEIRDYSGKKPSQYISTDASVDIQDIVGAYELSKSRSANCRDRRPWRFSKVLQSDPDPLRLHADTEDDLEPHRRKPVRRRSSLGRMKPRFERIRARTSQIVHRMSFYEAQEGEDSGKESRPRSHWFRKK